MHLQHPFTFDGRRRTAEASERDWLRGLVEQVLLTHPGERVNRPSFGSGLRELPFAGLGDEVGTATEFIVQASLQQWLGDLIRVDSVEVAVHDATLRVTVAFSDLRTGEAGTEVFERPGVA